MTKSEYKALRRQIGKYICFLPVKEDFEDLVSDVILYLLEREGYGGWRAQRWGMLQALEKTKKHWNKIQKLKKEIGANPPPPPQTPEARINQKEQVEIALSTPLSDNQREAILLFSEGHDMATIERLKGLSQGSMNYRKQSALKKMRKRLRNEKV